MNSPPNEHDPQTAGHDVLASAYRRHILSTLVAGEIDSASVEDLVVELIDHDDTADDRERIAIRLHHVELPKLDEAGFIEYDSRTKTARVCEHPPTEWRALSASVEGI